MSPRLGSIFSIVVIAFLTWLLPGPASATIIIDDFDTGPIVFTAATPNVTHYSTQSGLPASHVAGGVRHMDMFTYSAPASMTVAGGDITLSSQNTSTYFNLIYNANPSSAGGTPSLNLNLSGYEQFELTFSRLDRSINCTIRVRSGTVYGTWVQYITTAGITSVPLTSFSNYNLINWTDIDSVRLEMSTSYLGGGSGTFVRAISDFRVVPEPACITLLAAAGGLFLQRRRRQKI